MYRTKEKCPCCEELRFSVSRRRRNTSYVEEESNYILCCLHCYANDFEYYGERWEDYYRGRL